MKSIIDTIDTNNPKREELEELLDELRHLKSLDISDVDPDTLIDISSVSIKTELDQTARILDYLKQIRNPYCYKVHGVIVKVAFAGYASLENCLMEALFCGGTSQI